MSAKKNAIRLRKKLFCTDGRSPAIRTNMFISAKKNAEHMIYMIPIYFLLFIIYKTTIPKVPATMSARPRPDFFVSLSLNTMYANAMDTSVLNLSIGSTTLIGPS